MTTLTANEVFRDYNTDGVPASGPFKPVKADLREYFTDKIDNPPPVAGGMAVFTTRAAMAAFSSGTAYLSELAREGEFIFDASDLSAEVTIDTDQDRYVAPLSDATGASGAWVRAGSVQSNFWENSTPRGRIHRLADRVFVGDAVVNDGTIPPVVKDWMEDQRQSTTTNSQLAVLSSIGQAAILGASRTSDFHTAASEGCIGGMFWALNDNAVELQSAYGLYVESHRFAGAGTTHGIEIDSVNDGAVVDVQPYGAYDHSSGVTNALWLAAGGGYGLNDSSVAMYVLANGNEFRKGIVFQSAALSTNVAVEMAQSQYINWVSPDGTSKAVIRSDATNAGSKEQLIFADSGIYLQNSASKALLWVYSDSARVNGLQLLPGDAGNPVYLNAIGDDTNINLILKPKGTGTIAASANASTLPAPALGTVLHVANADGLSTRIQLDSFGTGISTNMSFRRSRGTAAAPTAVQTDDQLMNISTFGYGATGYSSTTRGGFLLNAAENWTDAAQGTYFAMYTASLGTAGATERVRVNPSGQITIGLGGSTAAWLDIIQAPTAAIAPLKIAAGTLNTTAQAGAFEYDGKAIYATSVASSRQVVAAKQIVTVQGTAVALSNSSTSAQNIFAAANDTLTVAASTSYRFRAKLSFNTGATTHTTAFGFGGTATFTNIEYLSMAISSAANTLAATQQRRVTASAAAVLTVTSTAVTTDIWIEGIIRINGAGTIIPQVTFSAGPTGTCETAINSFFELEPIGSDSVAAIGNWA